ncbi:alpha/beta hydrolase [Streptomyces iconiensis]|uniref:alpha/beta hydrolase n=1 Tax=Streptomyces iconiensis TaxID=1384038 RepID=UPI0032199DCD
MGTAPHGVVLVLPGGGAPTSARRGSLRATAQALPLARRLARAAHDEPLVAHVLHYRYRGWNGDEAHPAHDAEWGLDEVVRRYGDVPVCLVGVDVGGRAALRAGGHPAVASVLALGPALPAFAGEHDVGEGAAGGGSAGGTGPVGSTGPAGDTGPVGSGGSAGSGSTGSGSTGGVGSEEEPVRQLLGRHVLIVHGTDDTHTDPELSFRFAARAKKANGDVCRFEVHTDGHGLRQHSSEVAALARDFVLGTLCGRDFCRPLTDALAAPPPLGLRMPLASGFGRTLD